MTTHRASSQRCRRAAASRAASAAGRRLGRSLILAALVLVVFAGSPSFANAESVTITSPRDGKVTNDQTPSFSGESETFESNNSVTLYIDDKVTGKQVRKVDADQPPFGTEWSATVKPALPPGTYTAHAEQRQPPEPPNHPSVSNEVTFTIDTIPPAVTITSPANGSSTTGQLQSFAGTAGTAAADSSEVTINLYAGAAVTAQAPLEALTVQRSGAAWSGILGGLGPGTYTAQATQEDSAGNLGRSTPVTFSVILVPVPGTPYPVASFSWFPPAPVAGQSVVLVSSSTDAVSPITAFAWDVAGNGPFKLTGPIITTSFATAGNHVVRLQVIDARGVSSVASQTIPVGSPALALMQPFPIVRIAGVQTAGGVRLSLLSVQSPVGARVTVGCRRRGCKMRSQIRIATASARNRHASTVVLAFRRFERSFRAGVTLEVRVSAPGEIGKYTSFAIHRHSLPTRVDACVSALNPKPIACPG